MATTLCPTFPSLAEAIVGNTFPTLQNYAEQAFQSANAAAEGLLDFTVPSIPLNVQFNVTHAGSGFVAPPKPTREIGEVEIPDDVPDVDIQEPQLNFDTPAPLEPANADYRYRRPGGEPGAFSATEPGDAPAIDPITIPDEPDVEGRLDAIEAPEFFPITIPETPVLMLDEIEFEGDRPLVDFDVPAQTFTFNEVAYSSELLTAVQNRLLTMGQGGTGLPAHIESALFDRSRGREDLLAVKITQETVEEWGSRGFTEPLGPLARRVLEVRQGNQNAGSAVNRDLTIKAMDVEIENLRFFVVQGTALEQVLISMHLAVEERRFQAAKYLYDSFVAIFNARIALHNARVESYRVDAQVYRDRIEAEKAKVEVFKAEVDAQRAIGEINKILVERYKTQVESVLALIQIHRERINAVRAAVEVNGLEIEAYRATVQAFGEKVRAYVAQWDGYRARVAAEMGSVQASEIASRSYATRVQAWGTKGNMEVERLRGKLSIEGLKLQKFDGEMRKFLGLIEAQRTKVAADATALSSEASVYAAAGQIAQAESAAKDRSNEIELQRGTTQANLYLKQGEIGIQQSLQRSSQILTALQGAAQVLGQIASSTFAAINVSAGISDSTSQSSGCSTTYQLNGEIATP